MGLGMSDDVVDVSFLRQFFGENLTVDTRTGDGWTFTVETGDFAGYTITLVGAGLGLTGDLPHEGYVKSIEVSGPDGDVYNVTGLHVVTADLFGEIAAINDTT